MTGGLTENREQRLTEGTGMHECGGQPTLKRTPDYSSPLGGEILVIFFYYNEKSTFFLRILHTCTKFG